MISSVNCAMPEGWEQVPNGMAHCDVADVAFDQQDNVYLNSAGGVILTEGEFR
jgi:hypothetical protein